jgi:hypothetical protein
MKRLKKNEGNRLTGLKDKQNMTDILRVYGRT